MFPAMVMLGIANSRMKDFYDLWVLSRQFEFEGPLLCQAVQATFNRRRTPVPADVPLALSSEFTEDHGKPTQWRAFIGKGKLDTGGTELVEVLGALRGFLMPVAQAVAAGRTLEMVWPMSGPWRPR